MKGISEKDTFDFLLSRHQRLLEIESAARQPQPAEGLTEEEKERLACIRSASSDYKSAFKANTDIKFLLSLIQQLSGDVKAAQADYHNELSKRRGLEAELAALREQNRW